MRMVRWMVVVAGVVVVATGAHAGQRGGKTGFAVTTPKERVGVETIYLPTQASITRITLALDDAEVAFDEQPGFPRLPYVTRLVTGRQRLYLW